MEFIDLKTQYAQLHEAINNNILKMLDHGQYIMGPEVKALEEALADYVGCKYCISCANGTDALSMVLMAWDIGPGDAVFVPSFTFMATGEVVNLRGATPIFVDNDKDTFNMDPVHLESMILDVLAKGELTPKVIIPVDLFGLPADYEAITTLATKYSLKVLEDAAQGFGGSYKGKRACSFGDAATTSFFPAKPLGCYGDGGAIFTDDADLAKLLESIRVHGKGQEKYDNVRIGVNSRLDTIQAAILLPKLRAFQAYELGSRERWANYYTRKLCNVVKTPVIPEGYTSSWAQYTLILADETERDGLQATLKAKGIPSMVYYPKPLHQQSVYSNMGYDHITLPTAEQAAKCVLSLPMHPYLTKEQVDMICEVVIQFLGQ